MCVKVNAQNKPLAAFFQLHFSNDAPSYGPVSVPIIDFWMQLLKYVSHHSLCSSFVRVADSLKRVLSIAHQRRVNAFMLMFY